MKKIKIGAVCVASWSPKKGKMFSFDYYYDKTDDFYDEDVEKQVKTCDPKEVVLQPNTPTY